jgi:hypothetical protein
VTGSSANTRRALVGSGVASTVFAARSSLIRSARSATVGCLQSGPGHPCLQLVTQASQLAQVCVVWERLPDPCCVVLLLPPDDLQVQSGRLALGAVL